MTREETRAKIIRMEREGKSYGQIAAALGLSRGAVGGHISREKHKVVVRVVHDDYSDAEDATIRSMRAEGHNCGEIARTLGRPYDGVRKRGNRLGIVWNRRENMFAGQVLTPKTENEESLRKHDAAFVARLYEAYTAGEFPA